MELAAIMERAKIGTAPAEYTSTGARRTILSSRLSALALVVVLVLLALPIIPLLVWSFAGGWFFPALLPAGWTLRAWRYLASPSSQVPRALLDSSLVALWVTLLALLVGLPAGRALGLARFRGKRLVEFLVLAPTIVPGLASALGMHVVFVRLGLADTLAGVVAGTPGAGRALRCAAAGGRVR
jgi:putative spermidine/putrescine transport system permease protein